MNKKVKIKLFYDGKDYTDDLYVGINGKSYIIKRGVEVDVPYEVAEVIKNSEYMDSITFDNIEKLKNDR